MAFFRRRVVPMDLESVSAEPTPTTYLPVRITDGATWSAVGGGSSGGLTDAQLRATAVAVAGTVAISNLPAQGLTDTQLRATPVSVVASGTVAVSNLPAVQAVTGALTDSQLRAGAVLVSGPLTDTQLRATALPVSGPLTDTQLRATALPVSGTVSVSNFPAAGLTDTQLRASAVSVSVSNFPADVALTNTQLRATAVPVSVSNFPPTQPISGNISVLNFPPSWAVTGALTNTELRASAVPVSGSVSLANSSGKTVRMQTGTLATTANTADQVIVTYTVPAGTFYLQYFNVRARLTTFAATATNFGLASLEFTTGTKRHTQILAGGGFSDLVGVEFAEPIPVAAGTVIRIVCTPSAATAFTWVANFGGFER